MSKTRKSNLGQITTHANSPRSSRSFHLLKMTPVGDVLSNTRIENKKSCRWLGGCYQRQLAKGGDNDKSLLFKQTPFVTSIILPVRWISS